MKHLEKQSKAFQEGYAGADIYATSRSNPYQGGTREWSDWEAGFAARERELPPTSFSTYNRESSPEKWGYE